MRLDVKYILLGLTALSSLPAGSGRAVPISASGALDVHKYGWSHNVPRGAIRIGSGPKVGGGGRPGTTKPGEGGKSPSSNGTPPHIGTEPSTSKPDGTGDTPHIGDPDVFCRGLGCGGSSSDAPSAPTLSADEKKIFSDRGGKGIDLIANPKKGQDMTKRIADNYKLSKVDFEDSVEDTIPDLGIDKKYGFTTSEGDWQTWTVSSKNQNAEPIVKMSFSRSKTNDGKEYLAFVAHERFAERDGNRYQLTELADNIRDKDGKALEQPDRDAKAAPVSQLVFEAAQLSGSTKSPVDGVFLVSENVINQDAQKAMNEAFSTLGSTGGSRVLKKDATGAEADHFRIIAGTDNNYSYINTVGRNPDFFKDYDLTEIEIWEGPDYKMNMNLVKKA